MASRFAPFVLVALLGLAAGCDSGSSAPANTTPAQPSVPAVPGVPAPSSAFISRAEAALKRAQEMGEQGFTHMRTGEQVERDESFNAAIPHYQEAKLLLRRAQQEIEPFIEPEFGDITAEQVDKYMGRFTGALGPWQKAYSKMGKVPPK